MEGWKEKLVDAVRRYVDEDDEGSFRRFELSDWLLARELSKLIDIKSAQHAIELMELINRWHDEDVAKQPYVAPERPINPFIYERVEREIKRGNHGHFIITAVNHMFVNLTVVKGTKTPSQLRTLAKQLTDLADAHESIYPPQQHPDDL